jgi:multidrug transporter EmrE-like cation transporter
VSITYLPLILLGVFLNAAAQIFLKIGTKTIGHFEFSLENLIPITVKALQNPGILGGLTCYVLSVAVWIMALSRVEVSFAYPILSVGYIVVAIAGYFLLEESLGWSRILGIFVIILGVYLVSRS